MVNPISNQRPITRTYILYGPFLLFFVAIFYGLISFYNKYSNLSQHQESHGYMLTKTIASFYWEKLETQLLELEKQVSQKSGNEIGQSELYKEITTDLIKITEPFSSIVKLKIFNLSGKTIYSSAPEQVGVQNPPSYKGYIVAQTKEAMTELEYKAEMKNFKGETLKNLYLMSSYVPVINYKTNELVGVMEIYFNVTSERKEIFYKSAMVFGLISFIFIIVWFSLYFLVRKAELLYIENTSKIENERLKIVTACHLASLGEMAGGIAHEINNPLTAVSSKAQLLLRKLDKANDSEVNKGLVEDSLKFILKNTERISKIIYLMRYLIRGGGHVHDPNEEFQIKDLIQNVIDFSTDRIKKENVELKLALSAEGGIVIGQEVQISQIIINLLNNAVYAIKNNSEKWIQITSEFQDNNIRVKITDSGAGIAPEVVKKLFNPFYTTKPTGEGTGLGLSISKNIAKEHKGDLVYDFQESNTTFVLTLPLKNPRIKKSSSGKNESKPAEETNSSEGSPDNNFENNSKNDSRYKVA